MTKSDGPRQDALRRKIEKYWAAEPARSAAFNYKPTPPTGPAPEPPVSSERRARPEHAEHGRDRNTA